MKSLPIIMLLCAATPAALQAGEKLSGTPIGTSAGYNYELPGVEQNIQWKAFDGDLSTYFASDARSYTWVGLDLGSPHVIDRVGWSPRNDWTGPKRVQLGIVQGANNEDFLDAIPIMMITEEGVIGQMSYADVNCSKGFRYVRFVSTGDSRCNIAELEFYGTPGEGNDQNLFQITNLPTVCINTLNAEEPYDKEHDIVANIIVINDGEAYIDKSATVRERGNASRNFPKKPWRIKFDKKQQILPDAQAKAKKWTLINNYGDKTLMRNMVAFEIARRLKMPYVPYSHPVDVVLNGEYKGCYQLCDQVEVNPGRLEITEMESTDNEGEALTGGYFIEIDAYAYDEPAGEWFVTDGKQIPVTIKSPDEGGTPQQYAYIKSYFEKLEQRVWNIGREESEADDYRNIFDIESFINHFIVGELSGNTDTYWSTYMYKDRGDDKIYTGPVWDFDIAFDNDNRTYPIHNTAGSNAYLYNTGGASAANGMKSFVNMIVFADRRTSSDISTIWSRARNHRGLTSEELSDYIDTLAEELEESQRFNFLRWPIMNEWVHQNPVLSGSYQGEVNRLKSYLTTRISDLDILMKFDPSIGCVATPESASEKLPLQINQNTVTLLSGETFSVYTSSGVCLWTGVGSTPTLAPGMYIIRTQSATAKIIL